MYNKKVNIGEMNRRPVFENWVYGQDVGGGNTKTLALAFFQWAKIEDAGGGQGVNADQQQWTFDNRITVRYNADISVQSTVVYENYRYTIRRIDLQNEGTKRFMTLLVSRIDKALTTNGTIMPGFGPIQVYDYDAPADGPGTFQTNALLNRTVIGAFKDGLEFKVIYAGVPNVAAKEVLYTPATGTMDWSQPFSATEHSMVQYY